MAVVKRIGPGSACKVGLVVYACLGLIVGVVSAGYSLIAGPSGYADSDATPLLFPYTHGWRAIFFFPIVYGIGGAILGPACAWLYNLAAKWMGGLEIEMQ